MVSNKAPVSGLVESCSIPSSCVMTPEPNPLPSPSVIESGRIRRIIGDDGREWSVEECPAPAYDRRSSSYLIFRTVGVARRVRRFPDDWRRCSDAQLYQLSLGA